MLSLSRVVLVSNELIHKERTNMNLCDLIYGRLWDEASC